MGLGLVLTLTNAHLQLGLLNPGGGRRNLFLQEEQLCVRRAAGDAPGALLQRTKLVLHAVHRARRNVHLRRTTLKVLATVKESTALLFQTIALQ